MRFGLWFVLSATCLWRTAWMAGPIFGTNPRTGQDGEVVDAVRYPDMKPRRRHQSRPPPVNFLILTGATVESGVRNMDIWPGRLAWTAGRAKAGLAAFALHLQRGSAGDG